MKVHDISQELTSCRVFPGDPTPKLIQIYSIDDGDLYSLTNLGMCTHNGTHIDAPAHFIKNGNTVDKIDINNFVGECYVTSFDGEISKSDAENILHMAAQMSCAERILISGRATVTANAAKVFSDAQIKLLGNESQTVGPETSPAEVHNILLGNNVVLLEGVNLSGIIDGKYLLCAAPLNIKGAEGSPCRALLIEL